METRDISKILTNYPYLTLRRFWLFDTSEVTFISTDVLSIWLSRDKNLLRDWPKVPKPSSNERRAYWRHFFSLSCSPLAYTWRWRCLILKNVKFVNLELCIEISQLIRHVGPKQRHFSYVNQTQAIHYDHSKSNRISRYWDSIISGFLIAGRGVIQTLCVSRCAYSYILGARHYRVSWWKKTDTESFSLTIISYVFVEILWWLCYTSFITQLSTKFQFWFYTRNDLFWK